MLKWKNDLQGEIKVEKIKRANGEAWFLNLLRKLLGAVEGTKLINKMLIRRVGVKVVPANTFVVTRGAMSDLFYFERLFGLLKNVQGDVVECGVSSGTSLSILCTLVMNSRIRRHIFGFDTFEGLPAPGADDLSGPKSIAKKGLYSASPEMALYTCRSAGVDEYTLNNQITLVKGLFSQTLPEYSGSQIALLHIDADLYDSYKVSLENLWPKVAVGGIVAFDEYENQEYPGARKAIDEYFSQHAESMEMHWDSLVNKYYAVKQR